MKLNDIQKNAMEIIFGDPKRTYSRFRGQQTTPSHAQTVVDVIFQTQSYVLFIESDINRTSMIDIRMKALVKELRHGLNKINYGSPYRTLPINEELSDDTEENNAFWDYVESLLKDAVMWNFQPEVIFSAMKLKLLAKFYHNPEKTITEHASVFKDSLGYSLDANEKAVLNKEYRQIENWAAAQDRKYTSAAYPVGTSAALLFATFLSYGFDYTAAGTAVILASAEIAGTYFWGKSHPEIVKMSIDERQKKMSAANDKFLAENQLKPVIISSSDNERVIYTKFNEKLPEDAFELVLKEGQQVDMEDKHRNTKKENVNPKEPKSKAHKSDGKSKKRIDLDSKKEIVEEDSYAWRLTDPAHPGSIRDVATSDVKHVVETWGRYAQPNSYTYLDKDAKSVKEFKATYGADNYKLFKKYVRNGHVVPQIGSQGIKKLEHPVVINGLTYDWEAKDKGKETANLRFFAREVKSKDKRGTLLLFDAAGPALH